MLKAQRLSPGLVIDVLGGAVDAWLHPQIRTREQMTEGEDTMTNEMLNRCAAGGPTLSKRDQFVGSVTLVIGALVMAVAYIVLSKLYHHRPAVEAIGYMIMPGMFQLYAQGAYLRRRPAITQAVITGSSLAFIYLIMWGACAVAVRL